MNPEQVVQSVADEVASRLGVSAFCKMYTVLDDGNNIGLDIVIGEGLTVGTVVRTSPGGIDDAVERICKRVNPPQDDVVDNSDEE